MTEPNTNEPTPSAENSKDEVNITHIAANMVHAMLPTIAPLKVGGAIVLFDQETGLPITFASTAENPEQFVFMLSQLLEDGKEIKETTNAADFLRPVSGEISEKVEDAIEKIEEVTGVDLPQKKIAGAVTLVVAILALLASFFMSGCTSVHLGAKSPTESTYRLAESDILLAQSDDCRQDWVTGDVKADLAKAQQILADKKIDVVEGNPTAGATALADDPTVKAGILVVKKGFWEETKAYQVEYLSHELVHYCDLERLGADYELTFVTSNGRWAMETRAYAQNLRTLALQGLPLMERRAWIERRLESMRNFYWLWDIDPVQYLDETQTVWLEAAGV